MDDVRENVVLDYNMIILRHLDRLSMLTSSMAGGSSVYQGGIMNLGFKDRVEILNMGVNFLQMVVPRSLKDKKFDEQMDKLIKAQKEGETNDYSVANRRLYILVNLLERKGFLFDKGGIAKFKTKEELKEVWE